MKKYFSLPRLSGTKLLLLGNRAGHQSFFSQSLDKNMSVVHVGCSSSNDKRTAAVSPPWTRMRDEPK